MINPEVRHIIEAELTEGEELLWAEKPARHFDPAIVFGFLISGCVLMFIVPDTLPEIVKGWKTLSYGVVFMSFILLLALLWGLRAAVLPAYESYFLTSERVIIRRDIFPKQFASVPILELDRVKAKRQGRYGYISLMTTRVGLFNRAKYQGSLGFNIPFFSAEGFILRYVSEPEQFLGYLNQNYPQKITS